MNVNVAKAGKYSLSGSLYSTEGILYGNVPEYYYGGRTYISYAWAEAELAAGSRTMELRFKGSDIRKSKTDGPYQVEVSLQKDYEWIDSGTHTTSAYTYASFQTPAVLLAPPHSDELKDTDGDGLANYLVVKVKVNVTQAGTYSVSGSLYGGAAYATYKEGYEVPSLPSPYGLGLNYVGHAWTEAELSKGTQTVELKFDGARIHQSGINGPYSVELYIYGPHSRVEERYAYSWDWETSDYGTHTTGAYSYTSFQPPSAEFSPPHSDEGLDTDGDGLHDYLAVKVRVNVRTPGKYSLSGSLHTAPAYEPLYYYENRYEEMPYSYGMYIGHAWTEAELAAGIQMIELRFEGTKIRRSRTNGPYQVQLSLSDNNWNWLGEDTYATKTYSYTDFRPVPVELSPPHSEYALDTDGDDAYNYLVVKAQLDVKITGDYYVMAVITPTLTSLAYAGEIYAREALTTAAPVMAVKRVSLTKGIQTVELRLPGSLIYQSKQNGPYSVSLMVTEDLTYWEPLDTGEHTTSAYSYTQFQPPAAVFSPPHSDYGLDTDGDGLYDHLVVKAELDVRTAKKLQLAAFLTMESCGNMVDWEFKEVELDRGKQTVELKFDGWKIYGSHIKERCKVHILLLDPGEEEQTWMEIMGIRAPMTGWTGFEGYTTQSYSYDQFEREAPPYHAIAITQPIRPRLSPGEAVEVDITGREFPTLTGVTLAAQTSLTNPDIPSIIEGTEAPPGVPEPEEEVLTYIVLTARDVVTGSVEFRLEKTRLENYDVDTVELQRFEENWVKLPTEKIGEDENYVYFSAKAPGLSIFAVTAQAQLPTVPAPPALPLWVIAVLTVVLVVAILGVVWRYLSV